MEVNVKVLIDEKEVSEKIRAIAEKINAGFVPMRKPGKLPANTVSESYTKEYGVDIIDMADVKDADALVLCVAHKEFVSMSAEEINEAMKAAMLEITVDGLTGAGMTWTEDGEVNKEPKAVKIVDGAYTAM